MKKIISSFILAVLILLTACAGAEIPEAVKEDYDPPLIAYLFYWDGTEDFDGTEENPAIIMPASGTYSLTDFYQKPKAGIEVLSIMILNQDEASMDMSYMTGRNIRIDEIKVNGKPVHFEKNYTGIKESNPEYNNYPWVESALFDIYGDDYYEFTCWDGTEIEPGTNGLQFVDEKDFSFVESLEITFTYGIFQLMSGMRLQSAGTMVFEADPVL